MTFSVSSATPAEQALAAYERHQDLQREVTDADIQGVADYIRNDLLAEAGRLGPEAARAHYLLAEAMADAVDEQVDDADETYASWLGRLSLSHPAEAGIQLEKLAERALLEVAENHFDEFENGARVWGYIE
ncbi:hypothetical protein [Microbulbifer thermotolerans]|uniref:Uncharacterized protein n=1 Tax=Microbulbifer thermotolerans TaxID=252514 RepID=A0AB35I0K6_MICTH|nr:hypothetical protein [Microbulbifer thermotolerans]MCX2780399.1 hypothetical protein [Microbulbifer thermotolerans]MCX2802233.1 hypothetical protein [Microbulbifer thermotolerans]MCX2805929.1 hypothetical protein [Microbulbifer thermotolerans]